VRSAVRGRADRGRSTFEKEISPLSHPRRRGFATAIAVAAALSSLIAAGSASAASPAAVNAPVACPGTFQVLHNDHVGSLSLPAGPYVITANNVTCTQASSLFTTFLNQWTGKLPGGWSVTANGFRKGSTSFTVVRSHHVTPSGGGTACPGQFTVLHNTRIGPGAYAQGNYTLTLLKRSTSHFSCQTASRTFAYFLNTRYSKALPYPWVQNTTTKTFTEKTNGVGFRVTAVVSLGAPETGPKVTAGGGETAGTPCRPLYRVGNGARLDGFVLNRGSYQIWAVGNLSCTQARRDVVRAVALRTRLPKGWKHNVRQAIVTVGNGRGFRIKLAQK
jgi:hypothetical protein